MALEFKTIPHYLFDNYNEKPQKTAFREKDLGIWNPYTWEDYILSVSKVAKYFENSGVSKGDTVAIVGDNKPEWVISELAAQLLGAYPVGIYQDSIVSEVEYILQKTSTKIVVAEDQEQADKILEIADKVTSISKIIYYDKKGMYQYNDDRLVYYYDIYKSFEKDSQLIEYYLNHLNKLSLDDVAVMCTTSGTTGFPKIAMLTHKNLAFMSYSLGKADPKFETDEFVSFLPLPWIGEQMMCVASAIIFGFVVNFPENHDTAQNDMKEIGPNLIFSPPRVWENMAATVKVKIMDASFLKKYIYNRCLPIGYRYATSIFEKKPLGGLASLAYKIAYHLIFRKLKERLGFSNVRSAITGGAALGPDTFRFFHALGINLKQIYGQTEISGISCIHRADDIDFTSVGLPIEGTQIKITEDNEIISRSDAVFAGYYGDKNATDETLKDGWLYSGDAGYFDKSGKLVVIDRKKDLMYLTDKTMFSPQFIENKLKFSPFIKEAVVIGDKRDFIACILNIDMGIVGKWAEEQKIAYSTYTDLSSKEEIYELISKEVKSVNKELKDNHKIKKFILLYKELDADDGELTRTRKVRRGFISEKYAELIDALYQDIKEKNISATIKLQDGREKTINTNMRIYYLNN